MIGFQQMNDQNGLVCALQRFVYRAGISACAALALFSIPALAEDIIPPKVFTMSPGGVNMSDGSYVGTTVDLSIGPLSLERHHLGGKIDGSTTFFGPHMSHNFDIFVKAVLINKPAVLGYRYRPIVHMGTSASGVYVRAMSYDGVGPLSLDAQSASLTYSSGAYTYTTQDGTIYEFSPSISVNGTGSGYRVATITYPGGRKQIFSYNSGSLLRQVIDSSGYALVFDYNGGGLISAACGYNLAATYVSSATTCASATVKATYSYTSGELTSVTDASGKITDYTLSGNGRVTCVKPGGQSICKVLNEYGTGSRPWQVTKQTMADGSVWNYVQSSLASVRDPNAYPFEEPNSHSSYTDPNGKVTYYHFVQTSPYEIVDALGRSTNYRFTGGYDNEAAFADPAPPYYVNEGTLLKEVTFPEGNKYLAEYNGPWNSISKKTLKAKAGSGLPDMVEELGYGSCTVLPGTRQNCTKPIWIKDAKGNQTDFTYASHGGVLSEMKPAPSTGAARPLKLTTWVSKYAYIKNSSGTLVAAATPIWVMATETQCQTVAGSNSALCDTAAPQRVTTYEYGANGTANNLLVKGVLVAAGSESRRTCFGYDTLGRKVSETTPNGTTSLTSCP